MWMAWETASQLALAITVLIVVLCAVRDPDDHPRVSGFVTLATEVARVLVLYSIWQFTRRKTITKVAGAIEHAEWVWEFQQRWWFPSELALQRAFIDHRLLMQSMNVYYAGVHVPAMGATLVWLFWRHRDRYPAVRNVLAMTTAGCLTIQMIPVAPPRFLPELGFVDAGLLYHQSVYGTGGSGISNQLAAMPSLHYAWSMIVCVAVIRISTSRHRWWVLLHLVLTTLAVTVTANHWYLDGVVAGMVLLVAAGVQAVASRLSARPPHPGHVHDHGRTGEVAHAGRPVRRRHQGSVPARLPGAEVHVGDAGPGL